MLIHMVLLDYLYTILLVCAVLGDMAEIMRPVFTALSITRIAENNYYIKGNLK